MKVAVIALVLLGILAAASAAVLMATLNARQEIAAPTTPVTDEVDVMLASRDLPPMTVVDSTAVTVKKVPRSQVPEGALLNSVQVVGKVVVDRMLAEQIFTRGVFAREGTGVYLAAAVPPGKRAMSISLADWSGMAGLLYPGSVVDVLVSFKQLGKSAARQSDEMMATTLLQGLQVLAVGSQSIASDNYKDKNPGALAQTGQVNTRMVTLLVDPKQAEILQLATQSGSIALAMRNPLDASHEARRLTRAREIAPDGGVPGVLTSSDPDPFAEAEEPTKKPAEPAVAVTETPAVPEEWETVIIRGRASQIRTFPLPQSDDPTQPAQAAKAVQPAHPAQEQARPAATAEPAPEPATVRGGA